MTKMPPVPPANQSHKGTGDAKAADSGRGKPRQAARDPNTREQGHQGNIKQNTTNQGYQQDR